MYQYKITQNGKVVYAGECDMLALCGVSSVMGVHYALLSNYEKTKAKDLLYHDGRMIGLLQNMQLDVGRAIRRIAPEMTEEDFRTLCELATNLIKNQLRRGVETRDISGEVPCDDADS